MLHFVNTNLFHLSSFEPSGKFQTEIGKSWAAEINSRRNSRLANRHNWSWFSISFFFFFLAIRSNQPLNIKIEYWTVPSPGTISFTFLNVAEQLVMLEQPKKSNTLTTGQPKLSNRVMYPVVVAFCQAVLSFFLF